MSRRARDQTTPGREMREGEEGEEENEEEESDATWEA
jgi:hypothetical protein